ncbi:MAG: hypothetical protein RBU45_07870 [Myxococcota bacterium]|nr:hypothetical protein [Myxococcota bacterium]
MNQLIQYMLEHLMLDFEGELNQETVQRFLKNDNSPLSRDLRSKLTTDKEVEDFLVVMADCLREFIRSGVTPERVKEQVQYYVEA